MRGANLRIFLTFLVLSFLFALSSLQSADSQQAWLKTVVASDTFTGKVVGVSDGDTISVMRKGRAAKVRLHGIDCPEKKQPYGTRAKRYTSDMAFGKEVTVRFQTTDKYGRIVGEVILPGGISLNKELVYVGLAWWYRKYAPLPYLVLCHVHFVEFRIFRARRSFQRRKGRNISQFFHTLRMIRAKVKHDGICEFLFR